MPKLLSNYLDKHVAVNLTAKALTENRLCFIAAENLHNK
jgi:sensor c-di-GMP phosphodiesterase-like protein